MYGSDEGIVAGCHYAAFNDCPSDKSFQGIEDE